MAATGTHSKGITARRIQMPDDVAVFRQVWEIIHTRPWFYPKTGGRLDEERYLERAARPEQFDYALWLNGQFHTLVTTEVGAPNEFNFHITSQRKPDPQLVARLVYRVGYGLFDKLGAQRLYTYVPAFHYGSRRVAETCGLKFKERITDSEIEFHGKPWAWLVYEMTRAEFMTNHQRATQWAAAMAA